MAEYKYFCKARPPAPGAIPKRNIIEAVAEHVPIEGSHRFYWGWATYSEPLTDEEIDFYELVPENPTPLAGIWKDAVDYVHKQIHATQHALAKAQEKPGVTRAELENLERKLAVLDWLARLAIDKGEYI